MILLKDKFYDVLRWIAQLVLPGLATLYFALSGVWGFPYTEEIVGTIVSVNVWLGALLGLSNMQYMRAQLKAADPTVSANESGITELPFTFSGDVYLALKWTVITLLPATAALYCALAKFWGWPFGTEIVATVTGVTVFVGAILGISSAKNK